MSSKSRGLTLLELMMVVGMMFFVVSAFAFVFAGEPDERSEEVEESDVYVDFDTDDDGNTRSVQRSRTTGLVVVRSSSGKYTSTGSRAPSGTRTSPNSKPAVASPRTSPAPAPRSSPSPSPGSRR